MSRERQFYPGGVRLRDFRVLRKGRDPEGEIPGCALALEGQDGPKRPLQGRAPRGGALEQALIRDDFRRQALPDDLRPQLSGSGQEGRRLQRRLKKGFQVPGFQAQPFPGLDVEQGGHLLLIQYAAEYPDVREGRGQRGQGEGTEAEIILRRALQGPRLHAPVDELRPLFAVDVELYGGGEAIAEGHCHVEPAPQGNRDPLLQACLLAPAAGRGAGGEEGPGLLLFSGQHGEIEAVVRAEGEEIGVLRDAVYPAVEADGDALGAVQHAVRQLQIAALPGSGEPEHGERMAEDGVLLHKGAASVAAPDDAGEAVPCLVWGDGAADAGEIVAGQKGGRRMVGGFRGSGHRFSFLRREFPSLRRRAIAAVLP